MFRAHRSIISTRAFLRKFSTNNASSKPISTEEKAQEVSKDMWSSFKKYAILIIPSMTFLIVSIDIINNRFHREIMEEISPEYVAFVRKHYGFVDEDPKEMQRIKALEDFIYSEINVDIKIDDQVKYATVPGSVPTTEIAKTLDIQPTLFELYSSPLLNFPDEISDSDKESAQISTQVEEEQIEIKQNKLFEISPWKDSLWHREVLNTILNRDIPESTIFPTRIVQAHRFEHYTENFIDSWKQVSAPKKNKGLPDNSGKKKYIDNKIQKLEFEITRLRLELVTGFRDANLVHQDIKVKQDKISELKKKHINSFYFF